MPLAMLHPMLSLAVARPPVVTEPPPSSRKAFPSAPVKDLSARALQRLADIKRTEEELNRQELEALKMSQEEHLELQRTFASVEFEAADLDGLSWATPAAQYMLANWYKSQVLSIRAQYGLSHSSPSPAEHDSSNYGRACDDDDDPPPSSASDTTIIPSPPSTPLPMSPGPAAEDKRDDEQHEDAQYLTQHNTNTYPLARQRFAALPLTRGRPPLALSRALQAHLEAVSLREPLSPRSPGGGTRRYPSHCQCQRSGRHGHCYHGWRIPVHRVFSVPARVPPGWADVERTERESGEREGVEVKSETETVMVAREPAVHSPPPETQMPTQTQMPDGPTLDREPGQEHDGPRGRRSANKRRVVSMPDPPAAGKAMQQTLRAQALARRKGDGHDPQGSPTVVQDPHPDTRPGTSDAYPDVSRDASENGADFGRTYVLEVTRIPEAGRALGLSSSPSPCTGAESTARPRMRMPDPPKIDRTQRAGGECPDHNADEDQGGSRTLVPIGLATPQGSPRVDDERNIGARQGSARSAGAPLKGLNLEMVLQPPAPPRLCAELSIWGGRLTPEEECTLPPFPTAMSGSGTSTGVGIRNREGYVDGVGDAGKGGQDAGDGEFMPGGLSPPLRW